MKEAVLLGNEAIARGLVEAGVHVVTSYPGTPSSEILPAVVRFMQEEKLNIYTEWSVNEKVAYDVALAASYTGKRAAVAMKQVGLNVAADSLMSSVYTGVKGGFIVITADDPGPFSSQTEQDSRFWGPFAKAPVLDPSSPVEAKEMVKRAFELSEKYSIPVILRPALRVCHARQAVAFDEPAILDRPASFEKNPNRWAATPRFRSALHKELNLKIESIRAELEKDEGVNRVSSPEARSDTGIIAAGICHAILMDLLEEHGERIPVLKIGASYPFPRGLVSGFASRFGRVLVLETTEGIIEMQTRGAREVMGREDGTFPREGEPTPDNVLAALRKAFPGRFGSPDPAAEDLRKALSKVNLPVRRPTLCAGCPHRVSHYAIRKAFPKAIYAGDIGCYTLGTNIGAVDTVLDMGASIGMAAGFYHAHKMDGLEVPVVATIGDSTFYHAGVPPLVDSVYTGARFVLVILDNAITAMTGMQPTPGTGLLADGTCGNKVPIEELVRGAGVKFLKVHDPYDMEGLISVLKEAWGHCCSPGGGVAVVISRHPCLLHYRDARISIGRVSVGEDCKGCMHCVKNFECPAISQSGDGKRAVIDERLCSGCGVCVKVCRRGAIVVDAHEER